MPIEKINYKINSDNFCILYTDKVEDQINKALNLINSDKKILLLYDENISNNLVSDIFYELKATGSKIYKKKIKSKKKNKNIDNVLKILDFLQSNNFTKRSVLVCFGGGVAGDVSALVSALYMRGMFFINIPSTMTAIVDSCIGGKAAVNYKNNINLIGTYYHPKFVFIYEKILNKLPEREYLSGFPEIIKCILINKNNLKSIIDKNINKILRRDKIFLKYIIMKTLKIKIKFFINDVYENNKRLLLNFGHTFAHSIEATTDKIIKGDFLRHGEAVGIGIISELYLSKLENKNKKLKKNIDININLIAKILEKLKLPSKLLISKYIKQQIISECYTSVFKDKKKISTRPRYIMLSNSGDYIVKEIKNLDNINLVFHKIVN